MPADGSPKCFGFVKAYDRRPKRRLFEVLRAQGMQMNQQGSLPPVLSTVAAGGGQCMTIQGWRAGADQRGAAQEATAVGTLEQGLGCVFSVAGWAKTP